MKLPKRQEGLGFRVYLDSKDSSPLRTYIMIMKSYQEP